jgi:predicted RNA-binding Zn-ribbon protein involved in translation (DUF1610 family)
MKVPIPSLKRALPGRDTAGRLFECRNCGEHVDHATATCPQCGRRSIAEYDLADLR